MLQYLVNFEDEPLLVITNVANVANEQQTYNDADDVVAQAGMITDKMCKLFTELIKQL